MPSAANAKSEKPASTEATDNTPVRQIMTIIEHKIRNLEKRKSKLTSYRDLQKAGKDLNADQKVAVAKYDEVTQTLEFARDFSKQVTAIAIAAEREAKKQAKKDAWVRCASETNKIREVLLILDCLVQMGNTEARSDFLNGTNGAVKLTDEDLKILDELYPEVTPKHEVNEEGQPGFHSHTAKAAEHLYSIVDGRPKEILGTTYTRIKEIVSAVHECGYFDRSLQVVVENEESHPPAAGEAAVEPGESEPEPEPAPAPAAYPPPGALPVPPAPAVVPAPAYPLRPLPPITLQEVEHAYFARQYPQQRPIAEVIGSQNFFFLQESEIDSPIGTPQPPAGPNQPSPPAPIPTQTFTNQHFVQLPGGRVPDGAPPLPPQPHFPPHPEHAGFPPAPVPLLAVPQLPHALPPTALAQQHAPAQPAPAQPSPAPAPAPLNDRPNSSPTEDGAVDDVKEGGNPEHDDAGERRTQGQGDGQGRYRRYGRGGRGAPDGHRGRGSYQGRQGGDGYRGRHTGEYQPRPAKDGHAGRQYDGYQPRHGKEHPSRGGDDGYYGNGDTGDGHQHGENGGRDRYEGQSYGGGFKARGRGGPRGRPAPRTPRAHHYARKPERVE